MDIRVIKAVVGMFEKSALNKLEIKEGEFTIMLEKGNEPQAFLQAVPLPHQLSPQEIATFNNNAAMNNVSLSEAISDTSKPVAAVGNEVKSPMVGVYYSAPSPDKEPFVKVGSRVKKGDVLCVIEAMKVMNEITSSHDGEVAEILANNAELVEFGQVMFRIK